MGWILRFRPAGPPSAAELLVSRLWDLGTTGVFEADDGAIGAGFEREAAASAAASALAGSSLDPGLISIERADPSSTWVGDDEVRTVAVATSAGDLEVAIRTGPTFGHGGHPTTALAIDLLVDAVQPGHGVLDVGTGSGILAIVAAGLGATPVVAIDNDDRAVAVATENVARNGVEVTCGVMTPDDVERPGPGFDVVVMNVLLPVHRSLRRSALTALAPGGAMITSGYLAGQADEVVDLYRSAAAGLGLGWVEISDRAGTDGWMAHRFAQPSSPPISLSDG